MSRLNQEIITYIGEEFQDKYVKNCPTQRDETDRVLLCDSDSLLFEVLYKIDEPYLDESGEEYKRTEEEEFEEGKYRLNNKVQEITNTIEEWYNIKASYWFLTSKNNFRYKLYPEYKANRKKIEKPKWFFELKDYAVKHLNFILCDGREADDAIYESYLASNKQCVVATIDKDVFYYTPECPQYNYRKYKDILGEFKYTTLEESRLNIATQILLGDTSDGVNFTLGLGPAYAKKNIFLGMTNYQFIKNIFLGYIKVHKESFLAKNHMKLAHKVLKLYTLEEIDKLNL